VTVPFEFKPRGVLSGLVTDIETGEPVPNALITISDGRTREARTDANGFYSFETVSGPANFNLSVQALTHVGIVRGRENPIVNLSAGKQIVQHYQLPKACMLDVWVVDQNGVGLGDARVAASSLLDAHGRAPGNFAGGRSTDPNGYVLLGGIPPGIMDYVVSAWHTVDVGREKGLGEHFRRRAYDYAPGRAVMQLPDPNVIPQVTIVLEDGQDVPGYAEYSDGVRAADIRLIARPAWWHSTYSALGPDTADDGTFTFKHIIPGSYQISRYVARGNGGGLTRVVTQVQLPPADGAPLVIHLAERSPQAQVSISGTITFSGPKTPGYVTVEATSALEAFALGDVSYESDGTARFVVKRLEPGRYTLTFTGTDMEDKTVSDVVAPAEDLEVEMSYAPRPKLTGTVLDVTTGDPIRRFRARAQAAKPARRTVCSRESVDSFRR
jgi:Carboxypeptidase regulatory-like domain